jgi:hypothetical protein
VSWSRVLRVAIRSMEFLVSSFMRLTPLGYCAALSTLRSDLPSGPVANPTAGRPWNPVPSPNPHLRDRYCDRRWSYPDNCYSTFRSPKPTPTFTEFELSADPRKNPASEAFESTDQEPSMARADAGERSVARTMENTASLKMFTQT